MALALFRCSYPIISDLEASLRSKAQACTAAIALSEALSKYGISVKCTLVSKMDGTFDGQDGAAGLGDGEIVSAG